MNEYKIFETEGFLEDLEQNFKGLQEKVIAKLNKYVYSHRKWKIWKEIASVKVNGRKCGARCWGPFLFEITKAIRQGKNKIEVGVTNTQKNEFEKVARTSGLFGPVSINIVE